MSPMTMTSISFASIGAIVVALTSGPIQSRGHCTYKSVANSLHLVVESEEILYDLVYKNMLVRVDFLNDR